MSRLSKFSAHFCATWTGFWQASKLAAGRWLGGRTRRAGGDKWVYSCHCSKHNWLSARKATRAEPKPFACHRFVSSSLTFGSQLVWSPLAPPIRLRAANRRRRQQSWMRVIAAGTQLQWALLSNVTPIANRSAKGRGLLVLVYKPHCNRCKVCQPLYWH